MVPIIPQIYRITLAFSLRGGLGLPPCPLLLYLAEPFPRAGAHRPMQLSPRPHGRHQGTSSHTWQCPYPAARGLGQRLGGSVLSASDSCARPFPSPEGRGVLANGLENPAVAWLPGSCAPGAPGSGRRGPGPNSPLLGSWVHRDVRWPPGDALCQMVLRAARGPPVTTASSSLPLSVAGRRRWPWLRTRHPPLPGLQATQAMWVVAVFGARGEVWGMRLCLLRFPSRSQLRGWSWPSRCPWAPSPAPAAGLGAASVPRRPLPSSAAPQPCGHWLQRPGDVWPDALG